MVEASTPKTESQSKLVKSKYSMLEILSYAFTRREAIYVMRMINKRFFELSKDTYLENFS